MNKSITSQTGSVGEDIAAIFVQRKGFSIIEKNYRKPWGEIDIVAERDGTVHFIEVKAVSRSIIDDGSREMDYRPEEMVTISKLRKVARTAALYMESKRDTREYQIDVVGVLLDTEKKKAKCRFFEQVLEDNL